jgi:cysteinyl-tRNA synthetase
VNTDISCIKMKLSNTLTGSKSLLKLVHDKSAIGIYVCGVTPYDSAHVGHAMSLMVYDVA